MKMKKAALIFGIIFLVLTFAESGYVLINRGQGNAGYLFAFTLRADRRIQNKKDGFVLFDCLI